MMMVPAAAASAVAINTPWLFIPVAPSMLGFTARMYAIARKVVIPARTSVFTVVPFSFR